MKLLWLDLETTGLDAARHHIMEIAAVVADLEHPFDLLCSPYVRTLRVLGLPSEMDAAALEMHTRSGLLDECGRSSYELGAAEQDVLALVPELSLPQEAEDRTTLAGASVHFDLGFLRRHMPDLAKHLSHRVYDVSAIKLFCKSLGMPKLERANAHRALPDVQESIAHARACVAWVQEGQWGRRT
jgi:oligoribonuclease